MTDDIEKKNIINEIYKHLDLSQDEIDILKDNLSAFVANFGKVRIEREDAGKGFYVFYPTDNDNGSWIQYAYDINYLDGWLYGVVQGVHRGEFKRKLFSKEIRNEKINRISAFIEKEFPSAMNSFTRDIVSNLLNEIFDNPYYSYLNDPLIQLTYDIIKALNLDNTDYDTIYEMLTTEAAK
jgi:hypothetical protein